MLEIGQFVQIFCILKIGLPSVLKVIYATKLLFNSTFKNIFQKCFLFFIILTGWFVSLGFIHCPEKFLNKIVFTKHWWEYFIKTYKLYWSENVGIQKACPCSIRFIRYSVTKNLRILSTKMNVVLYLPILNVHKNK